MDNHLESGLSEDTSGRAADVELISAMKAELGGSGGNVGSKSLEEMDPCEEMIANGAEVSKEESANEIKRSHEGDLNNKEEVLEEKELERNMMNAPESPNVETTKVELQKTYSNNCGNAETLKEDGNENRSEDVKSPMTGESKIQGKISFTVWSNGRSLKSSLNPDAKEFVPRFLRTAEEDFQNDECNECNECNESNGSMDSSPKYMIEDADNKDNTITNESVYEINKFDCESGVGTGDSVNNSSIKTGQLCDYFPLPPVRNESQENNLSISTWQSSPISLHSSLEGFNSNILTKPDSGTSCPILSSSGSELFQGSPELKQTICKSDSDPMEVLKTISHLPRPSIQLGTADSIGTVSNESLDYKKNFSYISFMGAVDFRHRYAFDKGIHSLNNDEQDHETPENTTTNSLASIESVSPVPMIVVSASELSPDPDVENGQLSCGSSVSVCKNLSLDTFAFDVNNKPMCSWSEMDEADQSKHLEEGQKQHDAQQPQSPPPLMPPSPPSEILQESFSPSPKPSQFDKTYGHDRFWNNDWYDNYSGATMPLMEWVDRKSSLLPANASCCENCPNDQIIDTKPNSSTITTSYIVNEKQSSGKVEKGVFLDIQRPFTGDSSVTECPIFGKSKLEGEELTGDVLTFGRCTTEDPLQCRLYKPAFHMSTEDPKYLIDTGKTNPVNIFLRKSLQDTTACLVGNSSPTPYIKFDELVAKSSGDLNLLYKKLKSETEDSDKIVNKPEPESFNINKGPIKFNEVDKEAIHKLFSNSNNIDDENMNTQNVAEQDNSMDRDDSENELGQELKRSTSRTDLRKDYDLFEGIFKHTERPIELTDFKAMVAEQQSKEVELTYTKLPMQLYPTTNQFLEYIQTQKDIPRHRLEEEEKDDNDATVTKTIVNGNLSGNNLENLANLQPISELKRSQTFGVSSESTSSENLHMDVANPSIDADARLTPHCLQKEMDVEENLIVSEYIAIKTNEIINKNKLSNQISMKSEDDSELSELKPSPKEQIINTLNDENLTKDTTDVNGVEGEKHKKVYANLLSEEIFDAGQRCVLVEKKAGGEYIEINFVDDHPLPRRKSKFLERKLKQVHASQESDQTCSQETLKAFNATKALCRPALTADRNKTERSQRSSRTVVSNTRINLQRASQTSAVSSGKTENKTLNKIDNKTKITTPLPPSTSRVQKLQNHLKFLPQKNTEKKPIKKSSNGDRTGTLNKNSLTNIIKKPVFAPNKTEKPESKKETPIEKPIKKNTTASASAHQKKPTTAKKPSDTDKTVPLTAQSTRGLYTFSKANIKTFKSTAVEGSGKKAIDQKNEKISIKTPQKGVAENKSLQDKTKSNGGLLSLKNRKDEKQQPRTDLKLTSTAVGPYKGTRERRTSSVRSQQKGFADSKSIQDKKKSSCSIFALKNKPEEKREDGTKKTPERTFTFIEKRQKKQGCGQVSNKTEDCLENKSVCSEKKKSPRHVHLPESCKFNIPLDDFKELLMPLVNSGGINPQDPLQSEALDITTKNSILNDFFGGETVAQNAMLAFTEVCNNIEALQSFKKDNLSLDFKGVRKEQIAEISNDSDELTVRPEKLNSLYSSQISTTTPETPTTSTSSNIDERIFRPEHLNLAHYTQGMLSAIDQLLKTDDIYKVKQYEAAANRKNMSAASSSSSGRAETSQHSPSLTKAVTGIQKTSSTTNTSKLRSFPLQRSTVRNFINLDYKNSKTHLIKDDRNSTPTPSSTALSIKNKSQAKKIKQEANVQVKKDTDISKKIPELAKKAPIKNLTSNLSGVPKVIPVASRVRDKKDNVVRALNGGDNKRKQSTMEKAVQPPKSALVPKIDLKAISKKSTETTKTNNKLTLTKPKLAATSRYALPKKITTNTMNNNTARNLTKEPTQKTIGLNQKKGIINPLVAVKSNPPTVNTDLTTPVTLLKKKLDELISETKAIELSSPSINEQPLTVPSESLSSLTPISEKILENEELPADAGSNEILVIEEIDSLNTSVNTSSSLSQDIVSDSNNLTIDQPSTSQATICDTPIVIKDSEMKIQNSTVYDAVSEISCEKFDSKLEINPPSIKSKCNIPIPSSAQAFLKSLSARHSNHRSIISKADSKNVPQSARNNALPPNLANPTRKQSPVSARNKPPRETVASALRKIEAQKKQNLFPDESGNDKDFNIKMSQYIFK